MITYPTTGNGVTWTPVAGGAIAETSFQFLGKSGISPTQSETFVQATLPVRIHTSNEVTKAGISRTVIKAEAYLDSALTSGSGEGQYGNTRSTGAYAKTLTPVTIHMVCTAPRGAAQLASDDGTGLDGLIQFMLANLLTVVTGRSSDKSVASGTAWNNAGIMSALRGSQLFDPVSGSYGAAS